MPKVTQKRDRRAPKVAVDPHPKVGMVQWVLVPSRAAFGMGDPVQFATMHPLTNLI